MQAEDRNDNETPGARIVHPGSRQLFRYWESRRAERPCPLRSDISLAPMAKLLGDMAVLEQNDLGAWIFRLAGGNVCDLLRANVTGTDAVMCFEGITRAMMARNFDYATRNMQPGVMKMRVITDSQIVPAEVIYLPVMNAETGHMQLLCGIFAFGPVATEERGIPVLCEVISSKLIWTEHLNGDMLLDEVGRVTPGSYLRVIEGGRA